MIPLLKGPPDPPLPTLGEMSLAFLVATLAFVAFVAVMALVVRCQLRAGRPDAAKLRALALYPNPGAQLPTPSADVTGRLRRDPVFDMDAELQRWRTPGGA